MQCNFVVDSNGAGAILRMDKNAAIIGKFTLVIFWALFKCLKYVSNSHPHKHFCDFFIINIIGKQSEPHAIQVN